jgi:hypothetical protein
MATYAQMYDVWQSEGLRKSVVIACLKASNDILAEDPGTTNHANRIVWAKAVIQDPFLKALEMSSGVVMNAVIQTGTYVDNDVQFVVNSLVDTFAV